MERSWAEALDSGENVEVRMEIIYELTSLRPVAEKKLLERYLKDKTTKNNRSN